MTEMKKVGILTTHRQANWGSVLQCFALQEALEKHGFKAEVIDYLPEDVTLLGQLKRLKGKSIRFRNPFIYCGAIVAFTLSFIKRKLVFTNYIKRNLHLTDKLFKTAEEINEESAPEDIYCLGGDQTLNGFMMLHVFDHLRNETIKVSYSSSFGKTAFTDDEWEHEARSIKRFNLLSCREESGIKIMRKMGIEDPYWIIDPVFLLPKERWIELASSKYKDKDYILVYNLHHDKKIEQFEKELSKKESIPVVNICNHWFEIYRYGKCKWAPSVEDFLSLLINAKYVITDSFHATSFSIIFNKKFVSVVPELVGTRIDNILNLFSLSDRKVEYGQDIKCENTLYNSWDDKIARLIIEEERKKAFDYIDMWKRL